MSISTIAKTVAIGLRRAAPYIVVGTGFAATAAASYFAVKAANRVSEEKRTCDLANGGLDAEIEEVVTDMRVIAIECGYDPAVEINEDVDPRNCVDAWIADENNPIPHDLQIQLAGGYDKLKALDEVRIQNNAMLRKTIIKSYLPVGALILGGGLMIFGGTKWIAMRLATVTAIAGELLLKNRELQDMVRVHDELRCGPREGDNEDEWSAVDLECLVDDFIMFDAKSIKYSGNLEEDLAFIANTMETAADELATSGRLTYADVLQMLGYNLSFTDKNRYGRFGWVPGRALFGVPTDYERYDLSNGIPIELYFTRIEG